MQQISPQYPSPAPVIGWALILTILGWLFGYWADFYTDRDAFLFLENGPVESSQTVILGIAALIFSARAWRSKGPVAFLCIPVIFVLLHAMMRETPRCDSPFYPGGLCIPGIVKRSLSVIFTMIMAALLFLPRKDFKEAVKPRWSFTFWPLGVALIIVLVSSVAEKRNYQGAEEMLEMLAYCYALACSIWIYRRT